MKSTFAATLVALAANEVAGHALFQQLWVDGTDYISPLFVASGKQTEKQRMVLTVIARVHMHPHAQLEFAHYQCRWQGHYLQRGHQSRERKMPSERRVDSHSRDASGTTTRLFSSLGKKRAMILTMPNY
jgi:hypothetical protein